ncbi:MAG: GNAT family N-acetyltransferase [Acidimicrobiales bacterium]
MKIRLAKADELSRLQDIELAAGAPFAEIGMTEVAGHAPPTIETFSGYQQQDRAWVQADENDEPVAFLIADVVDGAAHIEQVSVDPAHAGRRLGLGLIEHVAEWAKAQGFEALTLTTFTEVAWNGPYYERCGFSFLDESELTPGLRKIRAAETEHGLDQWPRACMRRPID